MKCVAHILSRFTWKVAGGSQIVPGWVGRGVHSQAPYFLCVTKLLGLSDKKALVLACTGRQPGFHFLSAADWQEAMMSSAKMQTLSAVQTLILFQRLQTVSFSWTTAILLDHSGAESGWVRAIKAEALAGFNSSLLSSAAVNVSSTKC